MATHLAAVLTSQGSPLTLQPRRTPSPGAGELLIAVKSIALNPADHIMRDTGLLVPESAYPTVLGFDFAGLVLQIGPHVPSGLFEAGVTRVAGYAASIWKGCDADYGVFQERCLVPFQQVVVLPGLGEELRGEEARAIGWDDAATLPVAVEVALNAWDIMGIPRVGERGEGREGGGWEGGKKEALLVWGASSSVGTMGVQTARVLRDDPGSDFAKVYATAGKANLGYVSSLGADRVFDHREPGSVETIISAALEDGLVIRYCLLATGSLAACQAVLKAFSGEGVDELSGSAKIASAPIVPSDAEEVKGLETIFVLPSMSNEEQRLAQFQYWFGTFLREHLASGMIKPSPPKTVIGKGLESINAALDVLHHGVSCTKLVVNLEE